MIKNFAYGLLLMVPIACFFALIMRYPNVLMPIFMGLATIFITCMLGTIVQDVIKDRKKK